MNDLEVIRAMRKYGGSFVSALADAAIVADGHNLRRIKEAFQDIWGRYTAFAEDDANEKEND